jgi:hypothetical protein
MAYCGSEQLVKEVCEYVDQTHGEHYREPQGSTRDVSFITGFSRILLHEVSYQCNTSSPFHETNKSKVHIEPHLNTITT